MKEVMKLALEALERSDCLGYQANLKAIAAIKEALAQPEQEPVAWESLLGAVARGWCYEANANKTMDSDLAVAIAKEVHVLYTTPPQRTEQEPVAWMDADGNISDNNDHKCFPIPLYTTPPPRTWVGLTDEERQEIALEVPIDAVSITEAKLKEKNT